MNAHPKKSSLQNDPNSITSYAMKTFILTIRLDASLKKILTQVCQTSGTPKSEIAREA